LKSAKRPTCGDDALKEDGKAPDPERGAVCYNRSHLAFKVDPALCRDCKQWSPHSCKDCSDQASPSAEAFQGTQCPSCSARNRKFKCTKTGDESHLVGDACAYRDMFEGRTCEGWKSKAQYSDYDLGHLAASSDTYDQEQELHQCMRRTSKRDGGKEVHDTDKDARYADYRSCKWNASYMMTNIVPQAARFNRGCWRDIEKAVKTYSKEEDLDVVAGSDVREGKVFVRRGVEKQTNDSNGSNAAGFPFYMYKVACQKAPSDGSVRKCVGWYMENRNFYFVNGCRTPLTLNQLAAKLGREFVPGFHGVRSDQLLTGLVDKQKCAGSHFGPDCGAKNILYTNQNEDEHDEKEGTCYNGADCEANCQCCGITPNVGQS